MAGRTACVMTIIARLFRKTNRRRVMSGRRDCVFPRSEVNHLKSCNSTARSLPYANAESDNDCHLQCSSSRQPQPQRQQFRFSCSSLLVTSRRYYSLLRLSPFFLRVNEKFSRLPALLLLSLFRLIWNLFFCTLLNRNLN